MEKKRPFSKLTSAAAALNQHVDFVRMYAKNAYGHPHCEVTSDNVMQILSGMNDWNHFNDDQKLIINGILLAGEGRSFDELIRDAVKLKEHTDDFLQTYFMDHNNTCFKEVLPENYEQILSGKREWKIMPAEIKEITNAVLSALSGYTYEQFQDEAQRLKNTVENFLKRYAYGESGTLYDHVDADNYKHILAGEQDWRSLSQKEQHCIDMTWRDTGFEQLLNMAQLLQNSTKSFVKVYVSSRSGELYEKVSVGNYEQILSGWNFWKRLSKDQKQLIDAVLKEHESKIYENLVLDAKDIELQIKGFIQNYASDGNHCIWKKINAENYAQFLSGAQAWHQLEVDEQQAVNRILSNQGAETFEHMLMEARELQENLLNFVKTCAEKKPIEDAKEVSAVMDEISKEQLYVLKPRLQEEKADAESFIESKRIHKEKADVKGYKTPAAICGMLSIAAFALLGKKKKK